MSEPGFENLDTVTVNGTTLACRVTGAGPPLVLVHGSASDIRTWTNQIEPLSKHFRVIAVSRRYARPNADLAPGQHHDLNVHVEDLAALIRSLTAEPANIVGHSMGGLVALLTAIRHPTTVRSLVLMEPPVLRLFVDTPPKPGEVIRLLIKKPRMAFALSTFALTALLPAQRAFAAGDDRKAIDIFAKGILGRRFFERLSPERYQQVWDNRGPDRALALGSSLPPLPKMQVQRVAAPALLLAGAQSPSLWRLLTRHLHDLMPQSTYIDIPRASHMMHEDNPDAVNSAIIDFLLTTQTESNAR